MQLSSVPAKITITWGSSAPGANIRNIPNTSQIGVQAGAASYPDGFPPVCFLPVGAGGTPPFGQDFNGIFRQVSQWVQWQSAGASVPYDSAFSTAVGGYPAGAIVQSALSSTQYWLNTTDNNTNNPDTGSYWGSAPYSTTGPPAGWQSFGPTTGEMQWRPTSETIPGWVIANATTIGSGSSGGSQLASASAKALYAWHWTNFSNTQCPVTGGRGANALADFNANKPIQVLDMRGTTMLGMDTMQGGATTRYNSVPVVSGNATTPGSVIGENLHQLLAAELPTITPTFTGSSSTLTGSQNFVTTLSNNLIQPQGGGVGIFNGANPSVFSTTALGSVSSFGSNTAHNTVDRGMVGTLYIKL